MRTSPVTSPVTHSIGQMAQMIAGFAAVTLLIESGGLASWATHLEIGPLRTVAVPVTAAIERTLHPLGFDRLRDSALLTLARVGWTDDAALAAAAAQPGPKSLALNAACSVANSATASLPRSGATAFAGNFGSNAAPHSSQLDAHLLALASVPRVTALPPLAPVAAGRPRVVALAGDSMMAVGLSPELMREAAAHPNLRIVRAFKSGTGLARPEVFNWSNEYPAMLAGATPDVVIVAIGANDGQGFVEDGKVLPYGSDGWQRVYQQRVADYLAMVSAGGARVIWVGLPPMRVPDYNEKIAAINRIAYSVVSQNPQATWWNTVSFVGDDAGAFREYASLPDGRLMRLRQTDGIHLSDEGAGLLTHVLVPWLDPPAELAIANPPAAPPAVAPEAAAQPSRSRHHGRRGAKS